MLRPNTDLFCSEFFVVLSSWECPVERLSQRGAPRSCLQGRLDCPGLGAGRGCLQGAGVNIMTGTVRVMDGDDTATAPDVDTELCLLLNGFVLMNGPGTIYNINPCYYQLITTVLSAKISILSQKALIIAL